MIRSKKFFTAGSIVAISLMFVTLMCGFIDDGYHYSSGYSTYSGSSHNGYAYYTSWADYWGEYYWPLFALAMS